MVACDYCGATENVKMTQVAADPYGGGTYTYESTCSDCDEEIG